MKRNILFAFALMIGVLFFITGCGESGPSGPSDTDQINAVLTKAATSIQSKDLTQFLECVSDPVIISIAGKDPITHAYITDTLWPHMPTFTAYQFNNRVITVTGSTATVTCDTYQENDGVPGEPTETTITFSKSSGRWVITSLSLDEPT